MSVWSMLARPALIVIPLVLLTLGLYWPTAVSLFETWTNPDNPTYSHGLLVVAISVVLFYRLWRKGPVVELQPSAWGLLALAATSLVWLLAHLGYVQTVQQLSLLALIGLLLWAVLGYRTAKDLAFPVLLLLFAMPFWEFLNDRLQYFTAHMVTMLLNSTGITSVLNDDFISVPAGTFEVAVGCSGLAQLIVAMMVAALYNHVNELAPRKALLLIGIAVFVAIVTNTLRIYTVVVAGQLTDMQHYFVTQDHWTLGWVLFGIGMFVFLLWANRYIAPTLRTSSKPEHQPLASQRRPSSPGATSASTALRTTALALGALAVGPALAQMYAAQRPTSALNLAIPAQIGSWQATGAGADHYRPRFHGADVEYDTLYRAAGGANVYLYAAYYARQEQGKEAVYYRNKTYDDKVWKGIDTGDREVSVGSSGSLCVKETRVRSKGGRTKIVWHWYYVNGSRTSNDYMAKILNVLGTLRREPSIAVVVIATDVNGNDEKARLLLTRFVTDTLEKLERGIDVAQSM
jgi:exosortase A